MENKKEFETLKDAMVFIIANDIKDFYFKRTNKGIILHYFDKGTKCFYCDICGCITPYECEGAEPNVCADCLPVVVEIEGESRHDYRD